MNKGSLQKPPPLAGTHAHVVTARTRHNEDENEDAKRARGRSGGLAALNELTNPPRAHGIPREYVTKIYNDRPPDTSVIRPPAFRYMISYLRSHLTTDKPGLRQGILPLADAHATSSHADPPQANRARALTGVGSIGQACQPRARTVPPGSRRPARSNTRTQTHDPGGPTSPRPPNRTRQKSRDPRSPQST